MQEKYTKIVLVFLLIVSATLMLFSSSQESAIMDELAHIPAGYSYVRFFDYRLNPEHPPLLKALAGIPLLFVQPNFPLTEKSWITDINGQWDSGTQFLYQSKNNPEQIVFLARLFPILLTLLLGILIFFWGKELLGSAFALIPTGLFLLSPNILAHGHYVTTDIAATFGTFAATYAFVLLLIKYSHKRLFIAGIAFGAAELLKFSNVLLIPFFIFLTIVFYVAEWFRTRKTDLALHVQKKWKTYLFSLFGVFVIGYLLVYFVYLILTWGYPIDRQFEDTKNILTSFPSKFLSEMVIRFSHIPFIRPIAEYALGVFMVLQRASGGNTGYFLGEISSAGWWYYFPVIFFFKETIPVLILIFAGLIFAGIRLFSYKGKIQGILQRFAEYLGTNFAEFAMISFIILYWGYSMKSNLNIGIRHLFPTIPFIYLLTTISVKKFINTNEVTPQKNTLKHLKQIILGIILLWVVIETMLATPYFLSYMNEFGGGTKNGYNIATDSNYDWGQDLLRLQEWQKQNNVSKIAVDYFGGGSPEFFLGPAFVSWNSEKGNPKDQGIEWIAVSVNTLTQAMAKPAPIFSRNPASTYEFLRKRVENFQEGMNAVPVPDVRIGTSIFVYHLTK